MNRRIDMLNKEQQNELRLKYNPDGSILRSAQLRMLEMLLYIDKICREMILNIG